VFSSRPSKRYLSLEGFFPANKSSFFFFSSFSFIFLAWLPVSLSIIEGSSSSSGPPRSLCFGPFGLVYLFFPKTSSKALPTSGISKRPPGAGNAPSVYYKIVAGTNSLEFSNCIEFYVIDVTDILLKNFSWASWHFWRYWCIGPSNYSEALRKASS